MHTLQKAYKGLHTDPTYIHTHAHAHIHTHTYTHIYIRYIHTHTHDTYMRVAIGDTVHKAQTRGNAHVRNALQHFHRVGVYAGVLSVLRDAFLCHLPRELRVSALFSLLNHRFTYVTPSHLAPHMWSPVCCISKWQLSTVSSTVVFDFLFQLGLHLTFNLGVYVSELIFVVLINNNYCLDQSASSETDIRSDGQDIVSTLCNRRFITVSTTARLETVSAILVGLGLHKLSLCRG
jgi:hypothetical protein